MPDDQSTRWKTNVAKALKKWARENGLKYTSQVAEGTSVPQKTFHHVVSGNTITEAKYYAALYLKTGLPELDPRTLPPRKRITRGKVHMERRAFTEDEWQNWLKKHSGQNAPRTIQPSQKEPLSFQQTEATVGNLLDMMLSRLSQQIARSVQEQLSGGLVDEIVNEVAQVVERSIKSSSEQRSRSSTDPVEEVHQLLVRLASNEEALSNLKPDALRKLVQLLPYLMALAKKDPRERAEALSRITEIEF